jgi:hypothetical protein
MENTIQVIQNRYRLGREIGGEANSTNESERTDQDYVQFSAGLM